VKKYFVGLLAALARPASGADSHLASSEKACRDGLRLPALVESLEPRLLYSADLAPVALANQDAPVVTQQAQAPTPIQSQSIELVVLDSRVADPTVLLQDILQQQTAGRAIRVLEVSAEEDAFLSIGGVLDELHSQGIEVSAIHIVSHGRDGAFDLGNQTVDEAFLRSQPLAFAAWAQSLSENADLLVYGCNFAQSESGQSLSRNLAALTGADVAGNLQETGSLALGGDWTLDFATGVVESSTLFSAQAQSGWNFLLLSGVSSPSVVHGLTTADMTTGSVDDTLNRTGGSAIAMDNAGNYVVVWTDATNNQILLRRFSANGTALSAMQALSTGNNQVNPSVAMAADGSFVVVWSEKLSGRLAVVGQRVNADGTALGGNFLVASAAGVDCLKADVAINDDKDFVVVWQRLNTATSYDVYSQSFRWASSVGGLPIEITGELTIGASPLGVITGSEQRPVVAINGNRVFIAWEGADAVGTGIFMRAVNLDGTQATASVLVNVNGDYRESAPDIAVALDGRVIVVWQVDSPIANSDVIRFRIFEESGSGVGGLVAVTGDRTPNLTPGNDQLLPKVAVSPNGEFVITYQGFNQTINRTDGSTVVDPQWGVFIRHFDRLGNEVEAEQSVPDTGLSVSDMTLNQFAANVAWRGGQAAVAWTADGLIFSGGNVVARRFGVGVPSIIVTPPDVSTVNVGGTGREISVVLATQPTSDVTLNVSSTNGFGSVDKSTLVFTASNWYLPQKLLVTAVGVSGQNPLESFFGTNCTRCG
jgi:hypothetical protein